MPLEDEDKPLTLTREDLYELAWSKPISSLAQDFGISDVALAKRCRRLGIPLPGRGYWARLDAGQTPHCPKLPKRQAQWHDEGSLTVGRSQEVPVPPTLTTLTAAIIQGIEVMSARIAELTLESASTLLETLPAVKRMAVSEKHPRRTELTFNRGERTGPSIPMAVSQGSLERALLLANRFLRAAASIGWSFGESEVLKKKVQDEAEQMRSQYSRHAPAESPKPITLPGRLWIEGEEIEFRIEERLRDEPRTPTATELAREKSEWGYHAPRKVSVPTGNLRLVRIDPECRRLQPQRQTWYDRKGKPIEDQIKDALIAFYQLALLMKERRAEADRAERERAEAERLKEELVARQEANAKLVKQLETDAGAWHRARYLRRYIRAARRQIGGEKIEARYLSTTLNYLDWAEKYVDQLDPLTSAPRAEDFERPTKEYGSDDDKWKKGVARLLGAPWKEAWKVGKDYTEPPPKDPDDYWYTHRETSVFELKTVKIDDEDDV